MDERFASARSLLPTPYNCIAFLFTSLLSFSSLLLFDVLAACLREQKEEHRKKKRKGKGKKKRKGGK